MPPRSSFRLADNSRSRRRMLLIRAAAERQERQERQARRLARAARDVSQHEPETPDIEEDVSSRLLQRMLERQWAWEIRIDNLSLLHDTGTRQELVYRIELGGDGAG